MTDHRFRQQVAHAVTQRETLAHEGGTDGHARRQRQAQQVATRACHQGRHRVDLAPLDQRFERPGQRCIMVRPLDHHHMGIIEQTIGGMPLPELEEGVMADGHHQPRLRAIFGAQTGQGVGTVGRPIAQQLTPIGLEARLCLYRGFQHRQPLVTADAGRGAMRRLMRWHQQHMVQPQRFAQLDGTAQMAVMDGIEGTAEHGDTRYRAEAALEARLRCRVSP